MAGFSLHDRTIDRDRIVSGVVVVLIHVALGWALLNGLGFSPQRLVEAPLEAFDIAEKPPIPPPPPIMEKPANAPEREGRASPPNLKSKATPVVAPTPEVVLPVPPLIVAAPTPAVGDDRSSGNSNRVGPGTGSGGIGDGTGSGGWGNGPGGGGGGRPARLVRAGLGGNQCEPGEPCPPRTVGIRFTVGVDGHAHGCSVTASSGDRALDVYTCRKIEERLRYEPARDRSGRKIPQVINGEHEWLPHQSGPDFEDTDD